MERSPVRVLGTLALMVGASACHSAPGQEAPSPSRPTAPSTTATATDTSPTTPTRARSGYTAADVAFVQGMIHHHAQALAMTSLVPSRTVREDMRLLAERIEVSQRDEIAAMQRWLRARGESAPDPDPRHVHHDAGSGPLMPGMLTPAEMTQLANATGTEFDRLFLRFMIRHHEGALAMVKALFATPGAGQEPQLFDFASDVDADQRAEIARMRALLAKLREGS